MASLGCFIYVVKLSIVKGVIMQLFKQNITQKGLGSFAFYAVHNTGNALVIRSGTCGKTIKETTKSYASEDEATKAYEKLRKSKLKSGFFGCEGDENGPLLSAPFGLTDAPNDFSERLSQLAQKGVFLAPYSHGYYNSSDVRPLHTTSITNHDGNDLGVIASTIANTPALKDILIKFKEDEIDIHQYTSDQWERELTQETEYGDWQLLDKHNIDLGLIGRKRGFDSVHLYMDILNDPHSDSACSLANVSMPSNKSIHAKDEIEEIILERFADDDFDYDNLDKIDFLQYPISDVAKEYITDLPKPHTAMIRWLFDGCSVISYEVTTSSMYAVIGRPDAIKVYVITMNKSSQTYLSFHKLFFEC